MADPQGTMVDGYLVSQQTSQFTNWNKCRPFNNNHTPTPTDTIGSYSFDSGAGSINYLPSITFTLNSSTHQSVATGTFTWTFSGSFTGNNYYGVVVVDASSVLIYAELFSSVYTVPTGGGTLVWNASTTFQNCS